MTTRNSVSFTNFVNFKPFTAPAVAPANDYVAYVFYNEQKNVSKLVVRALADGSYSLALTKNLSQLYFEKCNRESRATNAVIENRMGDFFAKHNIKSTQSSLYDNSNKRSILEDSYGEPGDSEMFLDFSRSSYKIMWDRSPGSGKLGVLDTSFGVLYLFDMFQNDTEVLLLSEFGSDVKINDFDWVPSYSDAGDENGAQSIVLFYESNLLAKILDLSQNTVKFELTKPKDSKIMTRNCKLSKSDARNYCYFSLLRNDLGNDYVYTFRDSQCLSSFRLKAASVLSSWSITGRWFCTVNGKFEIRLYNLFGFGTSFGRLAGSSIKDTRFGNESFMFSVRSSDLTYLKPSYLSWGFLYKGAGVVTQQEYPILNENCEVLLAGDSEGNLYVFETDSGLSLILVLKHCGYASFIDSNDFVLWRQLPADKVDGYEFSKVTNFHASSGYYKLFIGRKIGSDSVCEAKMETACKLEKIQNSQDYLPIFNKLNSRYNLLATRIASMNNVVYVWDLKECVQVTKDSSASEGLVCIVMTQDPIISVQWHPLVSHTLLITTKHEIVIWSKDWESGPIVIQPRFDTKVSVTEVTNAYKALDEIVVSTNTVKPRHERVQLQKSEWLNGTPQELEAICWTSSGKFVVLKVKLNESQVLEYIEESIVNVNIDERTDLIVDEDDTRALELINGVEANEWLEDTAKKPPEDTFNFKKGEMRII